MTHDDDEVEEVDVSIVGPADVEIDLSDEEREMDIGYEDDLLTRVSLTTTGDVNIDETGGPNRTEGGTASTDPDKSGGSDIDSEPQSGTTRNIAEDAYPRGSFVFPGNDETFMQRLEIRGNNGAQQDVETVYLLTGQSYCIPSELIALDDPNLYSSMDDSSVSTKLNGILDHFERLYSQRENPSLIAYVHTHPNGSTRPSQIDKSGSRTAKELFETRFDEFEFFNIIHALGDKVDVPTEKLRQPRTSGGGVWWYGETRRHELAVYDEQYNSRRVIVDDF